MLTCQRYIELNPVRAGMVEHPGEYRWSSYQVNAHGDKSGLVSHHSTYMSLGRTVDARLRAYRELFRHELDPGMVDEIRKATNGNCALGTEGFKAEIADALGRRVTPGKSGRPRKR